MSQPERIADLFSEDIYRNIEEVIKVDALADETLVEEIREYYPTASIQEQMRRVLEAYWEAHQGPCDDIGVWVSGFFGAGKSSFAKMLGILLEGRRIGTQDAVTLFTQRLSDDRVKLLLRQIQEHIPAHVVIFDILKDNIAGAEEHPVTTVMYKALLRSLGYATELDLAELEINLEERGELEAFERAFEEVYPGQRWRDARRLVMTAINQASAALHRLDPATYSAPDTWARTRARAEVTPRKLAERAKRLAEARAGGRRVVFVVDEIGQYVARDVRRIGDLQGVVESFSLVGKGHLWLIATSQEKLEQIVNIYEEDRSDLVRLQDRFAHKVFLEPSDIREVASHRVLAKNAAGEQALRRLYAERSGQLRANTQLSAAIILPETEEDPFVQLYPLLPYQVELLISVVDGLRRGSQQLMGGANRTIIKLAQQLLVHPKVGLAGESIGRLVTLDAVYELLTTSIPTELQREVDDIARQVDHPLAAAVAKALVLLQFAGNVHTTEESIAAVLHPAADATSQAPQVREAVERLIEARKVRRTEQGLKIQSPVERTWDEERDSRRPTPGDRARIVKSVLEELWGKGAQAPSQQLGGWRRFTAGLALGAEELVPGDVLFEVRLVDPQRPADDQEREAREASQRDDRRVVWLAELSDAAERAIIERFRSERMQSRGARTKDEEPLLREEARRREEANRRLRDELAHALCRGRIYFRGNERSPGPDASDPKAEARRVLGDALSVIFHRFGDGNVRVQGSDVEAILKSESLAGLPACYSELGVVRTVDDQPRLVVNEGAAGEILDWIRRECDGSRAPSGRLLEQHFGAPPYGWSLELVQLGVGALLRAGEVTITAESQTIKNALTPEARRAVTDNRRFRALTVRIREGTLDARRLRRAAQVLEQRFGATCRDLTAQAIAGVVREQLCVEAPRLEAARDVLRELRLPGEEVLSQALTLLREMREADDEDAVQQLLESADTLAKAIPRARAIESKLTPQMREMLVRARVALEQVAPVIEADRSEDDEALAAARSLAEHLQSETFYERLPAIEQASQSVIAAYQSIYEHAFEARRQAYAQALERLHAAPGWAGIEEAERRRIEAPLAGRAAEARQAEPWRSARHALEILREQTLAAETLLHRALDEVRRLTAPQAVVIDVGALIPGEITDETLEQAMTTIREAIERALAEGHPVVLR